jgi:membrane-associated phospholipid phosphatase
VTSRGPRTPTPTRSAGSVGLVNSVDAARALTVAAVAVALFSASTAKGETAPDKQASAPSASPSPDAAPVSRYYELDNTGALFLGVETGISAGAFLGVALGLESPTECKWCTPPGFDVSIRNALVWSSNRGVASSIADGLGAATGAGALAAVIIPPLVAGDARHASDVWALEDALIVVNTALVNLTVTEVLKVVTARERPAYYFHEADQTSSGEAPYKSFPSGHTSSAFAAASSATTLSFMRGYSSAPYVAAGGGALALTTGLFRIFADKHWATDVITGAVLGSAIGFSMPFFLHGRVSSTSSVQDLSISAQPLEIGGPRVITLGGRW